MLEITSHIAGKNAKVRVYPDRVEWDKPGGISGGKMALGLMTVGLSLAATGVRGRKGAGTEMIPMSHITAVNTTRDTIANDTVHIVTAGSTISLRCSKREAAELQRAILWAINNRPR